MDNHERLKETKERPTPDERWNIILMNVKQAAEKHFARARAGKTAAEEAWFQKRRRPLKERGQLRFQRAPRPPRDVRYV